MAHKQKTGGKHFLWQNRPTLRDADAPLPADFWWASNSPDLVEQLTHFVPGFHPLEQQVVSLHDDDGMGGLYLLPDWRHRTKNHQRNFMMRGGAGA